MPLSLFGSSEKRKRKSPAFSSASSRRWLPPRRNWWSGSRKLSKGKQTVDQSVLDDLEATLITADLGVKTTGEILERLREQVSYRKLTEPSNFARRSSRKFSRSSRIPPAVGKRLPLRSGAPGRHARRDFRGGSQRGGQDHEHCQAGRTSNCSRTASRCCARRTHSAPPPPNSSKYGRAG